MNDTEIAAAKYLLNNGDIISIGERKFRFEYPKVKTKAIVFQIQWFSNRIPFYCGEFVDRIWLLSVSIRRKTMFLCYQP